MLYIVLKMGGCATNQTTIRAFTKSLVIIAEMAIKGTRIKLNSDVSGGV